MPKPKVVVQKCGLLRKFRRNRGRALLFAAAATSGSLLPANTSQANTNVYFSDPNTNTSVADDWSVGTNWSPAGVPNSASDDVWIYGGSNGFPSSYANVSPVTDDYTASVDQVLVDSAGLNIENGVSLTMNQEYVGESSFAGLYNYGTLNINTGSNSALFVGFASTSIANDFNYGTTNINAAFIGYGGRGNYQNEGGTDNFGTLEVGAEAESTSIGSFGIDSSSSVVTANAEYVGTADGGASSISQSLGSNTIAGALTIASTGTYNLGGGTLTTASISVASGGTFNWTAGTLNITNSTLTVGTGGPLGSNLTLVSGQTLQILGLSNSLFVENGTLNESGDAAITVDDYIDVGNSGTGTVNQSGGTDLTNYLFLGYNSGASGTYNLGGTGALYVDVDEHIGTSGSALFTQNGGTNTAGGTLSIGSSGTYTLSNGMLSAGALNIASGGTFNWTSGTLNITNSSLMVGSGGLFPSLALGSGQTLQISNTNQSLNDNSTISLTGGGQASSSFINIGENSAGVATVTGSGSTLSSSKSLILGGGGTGTLGVSNGGQVSGYEVQIGEGANANVTVDGQGSTLSSSVYIYLGEVGFTSTATLDVTNGAQVSSPFIQLQGGSGSICTAQVSGSGATLSATTECVVGVGSGNVSTLSLNSGGQGAAGASGLWVGVNSGTGTLTLGASGQTDTGGTAFSTPGPIYVGTAPSENTGTGIVNVYSGTTLSTTGLLEIWNQTGDIVNLAGGTINAGTLTTSGATINSTTGLPNNFNWTSGTLNLTNSSLLIGTQYPAGPTPLTSSLTLGSDQTLQLSGTNSDLIVSGGSLSLTYGQVQLTGAGDGIAIGYEAPGSMSIAGTRSILSAPLPNQDTFVGSSGASGTLSISQGAEADLYFLGIGDTGPGNVTVTGSRSTLDSASGIWVGLQSSGSGTLSITNGASVQQTAFDASSYVAIGFAGGTGTLNLGSAGTTDSGATFFAAGSIYVGGNDTGLAGTFGTGAVNVYGGTTLYAAATLKIWNSTGTSVNLAGGTIQAATLDTSGNPALFNWTSGTLNLTNSSLTVGSGGTLGSSLTLGSGQTLNISGAGQGLIDTGAVNLSGGSLTTGSLTLSGGYLNWSGGTLSASSISETQPSDFFYDTAAPLVLGTTNANATSFTITNEGSFAAPAVIINSGGTYTINGYALWGDAITVNAGGTYQQTGADEFLTLTNNVNYTVAGAGALLSAAGNVNIGGGGYGSGYLTVGSGGTTSVNGTLTLTSGTIDVNGGTLAAEAITQTGGTFTDTDTLSIGSGLGWNTPVYSMSGGSLTTGALSVYGGETFSMSGGAQALSTVVFDGFFGSGDVTITGSDTSLSASSLFVAYDGGSGTLSVSNGGQATVGTFIVGYNGATAANATITGSSSTLSASSISVGEQGTGTLLLSNGGQATGGTILVGDGGTGSATITGSGSTLSAGYELSVGVVGGTGTLSLSNGGQATAGQGGVVVGGTYGTGTVNLGTAGQTDTGGTSLTSTGSVYVGADSTGQYFGTGVINIYGGTTLSTAATLKIWNSTATSVNLAGGTIQAATLDTSGNSSLFNWTAGTLAITGSIINTPTITVPSGSKLIFEPNATAVTTLNSLLISPGGIVDLGNNKIFIDYGSGPDPIASIAQWIKNGFYGLPGPEIISSAIATDDALTGLSYGIGYADGADGIVPGLPSGEIEIMFTLLGDANLDGTVNAEDFTQFSQNLGQSGSWDNGDFNYDGTVNAEDFTSFSANLGQTASLAAQAGVLNPANAINLANVPEPASAGMMAIAGLGILRRRRRSFRQPKLAT